MKWIFRLTTILVLVAAMALPFFIDNNNGEPMLSLPSTESFLPSKSSTATISNVLPTTTTVFKWKDASGVWHYTDQAPTDRVDIETVEIDTRTNIIQSFSDSSPDVAADSAASTAAKMTSPDAGFFELRSCNERHARRKTSTQSDGATQSTITGNYRRTGPLTSMYKVKEMFYSLQGEGARAGRAAVFCRFSKCNLWNGREEDRLSSVCQFCDTDIVGTDGQNGGVFESAEALARRNQCAMAKRNRP